MSFFIYKFGENMSFFVNELFVLIFLDEFILFVSDELK